MKDTAKKTKRKQNRAIQDGCYSAVVALRGRERQGQKTERVRVGKWKRLSNGMSGLTSKKSEQSKEPIGFCA